MDLRPGLGSYRSHRQLILVDAKPSVRKQILRELQIMNDCNSPYIVGYFGCFPVDVHVGVVMEFMDAGWVDVPADEVRSHKLTMIDPSTIYTGTTDRCLSTWSER